MKNPFIPIFRHPFVISAILILLVNDHVFKHISPTWFTGKISDFSGLFFFPFLVALFLFELTRRLRIFDDLNPNQWLIISLGVCAIIFSALKTIPTINHFAIKSLSVILHTPVQIILDPTDLAALCMFFPAWFLWNHIQTDPPAFFSNKQVFFSIILAAFASIASTPSPSPMFTDSFFHKENEIYAYNGYTKSVLIQYVGENTWISIDDDSISIADYALPDREDEKTVCIVPNPNHCFRIHNQPIVEESFDNGNSWSIAWEIPDGRKIIFDREEKRYSPQVGLNTIPKDLIYVPNENKLFVAMGDNGLLVWSPEGDWQQISVKVVNENGLPFDGINPSVIYASSFSEAFSVYSVDFFYFYSISILVIVIYCLIVVFTATSINDEDDENVLNHKRWAKRPTNVLIFITILVEFVLVLLFLPKFSPILIFSGFIVNIMFILLIAFYWLLIELTIRIIKSTGNDKYYKNSFTLIFANHIILIVIPIIIFNLWAFGIIINHQVAWGITIAFIFFTQIAASIKLRSTLRRGALRTGY